MTEAEQIMKRCQAGTRNYEEANNLHAACYGIIGKLLAQPEQDYERGFIDGMQKQMQSSVDKAVNRIAQPEQEPVAWRTFDGEGGYDYRSYEDNESYADDWNKRNPNHVGWVDELYTHSQRTWVKLTDGEMEATFIQCGGKWNGDFWKIEDADFHPFLRTIEAKLKEKL
jgi:hypothetical protein